MAAYLRMNGLDYALGPGVTIVGRDRRSCDVVVPHDERVSGVHAYVVALPDDEWLLIDAKSSNGSWVDGRRVEEAMLADGMRVTLGNTQAVARVGVGEADPAPVPDLNRGRLRSGTAQLLPAPPRLQRESARSAFDQLRGLQNACLALAGEPMAPGARLQRLASLAWALLGPVVVSVVSPDEARGPWRLQARAPEDLGEDALPVWARSPWPVGLRGPVDRARIVATLTRLAGPFQADPLPLRLVRPVVLPVGDATRGTLQAAVQVITTDGPGFAPARRQLLDDLCLAAGVGLAGRAPR